MQFQKSLWFKIIFDCSGDNAYCGGFYQKKRVINGLKNRNGDNDFIVKVVSINVVSRGRWSSDFKVEAIPKKLLTQ